MDAILNGLGIYCKTLSCGIFSYQYCTTPLLFRGAEPRLCSFGPEINIVSVNLVKQVFSLVMDWKYAIVIVMSYGDVSRTFI